MLYSIGASYNTQMSQPNNSIRRSLAGVDGLSFQYRLNQWGPKVGPPMIPANIAGFTDWIVDLVAGKSPAETLKSASDTLKTDLAKLPGSIHQLTNLLTQLNPYNGSPKLNIKNRAQALAAQATGLAGVVQNWQTTGEMLAGEIYTAQSAPSVSDGTAKNLFEQTASAHSQMATLFDSIQKLGSDVVDLLKDAGASSSVVESVQNTISSSVSTLTWIVGGSLMAYLLLPTFLPRVAGGIRKSISA